MPPRPPPVMPDINALNPCKDHQYAPGSLEYNPPCWKPTPPVQTKDVPTVGELPPEVLIPLPYSHIDQRPLGCPQCPQTATQKALEAQRDRELLRAKGDPFKGMNAEQYAKEREKIDKQAAEDFKKKFDERAKATIANQQKIDAEAKKKLDADLKTTKENPEPPALGLVPPPMPPTPPPPQTIPTPIPPEPTPPPDSGAPTGPPPGPPPAVKPPQGPPPGKTAPKPPPTDKKT